MAETGDLFSITRESIRFEERDVLVDHVKIASPRPRPMNKEAYRRTTSFFGKVASLFC